MLNPLQSQLGAARDDLYVLRDFLEMRADLTEKKRTGLLKQLGRCLDLTGDVKPLSAFMIGTQAVLCTKDDVPETYWIYNSTLECLSVWKEPSRTTDTAEALS